ncbi:LysR family transcriptional regulator [Burkholderia gladioli]|uniref:LysR family transcriptional regulator n=1 Tax=Burkholderia gladioli TaxID=28095 RepID=UPI000BEF9083|nr:LysR family transcriptional regulator [Burkholderia gladioli]MBJ9714713.1 LysR family transcriptional regulator [Burkholderia gladioli]MBU9154939.1 LysR family transcriptional regulator [Burkholderia gladioli]MBU9166019.1 LysR family transcriptional regulator [Burkholderia gladioli]MBU9195379.1 LysR family transcriptional regulator [Burkholderia gladioli]MBU9216261.1 LysR family transcriptional regulator [Burkholderia gladioli]
MHRTGLTELEVVLAVARLASFRAASRELGMSTTAVSAAVAGLEARLKVRLFNRSTRSVALTDAGQRYVERVAPALAEIRRADEEAGTGPDMPSGTLRLNAPPETATMLVQPLLAEYLRRYPQVRVDVVSDLRLIDIVADGFDAGIRLAESVPQDMIAVPLTDEIRMRVVATPGYLARHGTPREPAELVDHQLISMRLGRGVYHWELERAGQKFVANLPMRLVFSDSRAIRQATLAGLGLGFLSDWFVSEDLARGALVPVLDDWCQPFGGLRLYYPGRRFVPARLRALIELVQERRANGLPVFSENWTAAPWEGG